MPVYQRLASTSLLERCVSGRTQNANESLHSMIWRKCPKEGFGSVRRVEIAVAQAVCDFNVGKTKTLTETQKAAGLSPGRKTLLLGLARDSHRIIKAKKRSNAKYQKARRCVKMAKLRLEEAAKAREGTSYKAGQF